MTPAPAPSADIVAFTNDRDPYDGPHVVTWPIIRADAAYRAWVFDSIHL